MVPADAVLARDIAGCRLCEDVLPLGPRPVLQFDERARILIAGQAPGRRVHESGVPFDDPSGVRLREWLGLAETEFYDAARVALVPMGFCYPGRGKAGDLPPRPECAQHWHRQLLPRLTNIKLTVLLGRYALSYHLPEARGSVTEVVRNWRAYEGSVFPLPHPSPRNNLWLRRNPWFESELLPVLRERTRLALGAGS